DPVRAGYAASIARPGGNITGLFMDTASLAEKWMELLREIVPGVERVALIWDPTTGSAQLDVAKAAARSAGIEAVVVEVRAGQDYQELFRNLGRQKRMGAIQLTTPVGNAAISSIAMAAQKSGLPAISFQKSNTQRGALLSYGPDQWSYFPCAVVLADRILKGAKAAELPIERPTRFELVINLKTAKALGLTIPPSILARADEVIE
ncbi:MAG: ABC transporter substrate-binding protein, partial [Alphaproteobacteria bacterium]